MLDLECFFSPKGVATVTLPSDSAISKFAPSSEIEIE